MDDFEIELKQSFLDEAVQHLENCEEAFIALESGSNTKEAVEKIFRLAHNFKGSAKAVGFEKLSVFAHKFEDVLSAIKKGQLSIQPGVISTLLETLDALKLYLSGLKKDFNYIQDTSAIELSLASWLTNSKTEVSKTAEAPTPPPMATVEVREPVDQIKTNAGQKSEAETKRATSVDDENIRIATRKLDGLLNLIGELVVNQSMVTNHRVQGTIASDSSLATLAYIEKIIHEIQDVSMSFRMVAAKPLFQKMKRALRDISILQNKPVDLICEGEHVELDKTILDKISDPLTHLIRNAIDHGIESREDRIKAGKAPEARVALRLNQQDDQIQIVVEDDGRGIDKSKVLKKAIEKGLIAPQAELSDQEAYSLIFQSGFSTKEQVSDISGRGVGLDVVQQTVEDLKGSIHINTSMGRGTTFTISLPLSLSVITGMIIDVDQRKYVVPMTQMVETISYKKLKVVSTTGSYRMVDLRGEVIPVVSLSNILHGAKRPSCRLFYESGVVAAFRGKKISFEVDGVVGQQQIVMKKLGHELNDLPGIIAGAILSNGEPGLILNLHEFFPEGGRNAS